MKRIFSICATMMAAASLAAQTPTFDVNTTKVGGPIPSTMYGIFFEDINYAADGGLYGELVKNRSFEFPNNYAGWDISGKVTLKDDGPFNKNPHYVRLAPSGHSDKHTMIENHGFFGMGVKGGAEYRFSVWAMAVWRSVARNGKNTPPSSSPAARLTRHICVYGATRK